MDSKFIAEFSEKERKQALKRFNVIQPFLSGEVPLIDISAKTGISYRTLKRWLRSYCKDNLVGLIDKVRCDKGMGRSIKAELKTFIEGFALQRTQPSIASIYRKTKEVAISKCWTSPSYTSVYNIVKSLNPAMVSLATEGSKAYSEKYELLYKRKSKYPNEIWQADHSLLDIWLVTDDDKNRRPWLTIIMDDYSRGVTRN